MRDISRPELRAVQEISSRMEVEAGSVNCCSCCILILVGRKTFDEKSVVWERLWPPFFGTSVPSTLAGESSTDGVRFYSDDGSAFCSPCSEWNWERPSAFRSLFD